MQSTLKPPRLSLSRRESALGVRFYYAVDRWVPHFYGGADVGVPVLFLYRIRHRQCTQVDWLNKLR